MSTKHTKEVTFHTMTCKSKGEPHLSESQNRILSNPLNAAHGKGSGHTPVLARASQAPPLPLS